MCLDFVSPRSGECWKCETPSTYFYREHCLSSMKGWVFVFELIFNHFLKQLRLATSFLYSEKDLKHTLLVGYLQYLGLRRRDLRNVDEDCDI